MTAKVSRAHVAGGGCPSHVDWNCQVGSWAVGLVGKDGLIKAGNVESHSHFMVCIVTRHYLVNLYF